MSELLFYDLKDVVGITPNLTTQVSREIGRRIVAGHYRENDLVEDEGKLAARFGVSKTVVREAVKLLVAKGLLEVRRGIGTRVRRRSSWNLLDDDVLAWHQGVEPRPEFLRQLMDVRQVFEPSAAAWAAVSATDEQILEIRSAQDRMESAASIEAFVVADALFHRAILRAANNEILMAMEGVIFSALLSSIRLTNADPRENQRSIPLHRQVLEAIEARDGARAMATMTEHLGDTHTRLSGAIAGFGKAGRTG
ncbi:FadR/GntR family transcriptional regulator [Frigidibacter sp. ROC022]|uniref:FadR/GntR family transcriptional regulator n=1 Tax=Frigidibacter sp. ROC022 TaxID=2971796 RepID=UPI00215A1713|nr:FadR/GntR family transcriptional regulator [Frigidibacter sp. ROC022]MCR8723362.1 FadR family transcriptional regulator [Frigidibacter sp. ROC022]